MEGEEKREETPCVGVGSLWSTAATHQGRTRLAESAKDMAACPPGEVPRARLGMTLCFQFPPPELGEKQMLSLEPSKCLHSVIIVQ